MNDTNYSPAVGELSKVVADDTDDTDDTTYIDPVNTDEETLKTVANALRHGHTLQIIEVGGSEHFVDLDVGCSIGVAPADAPPPAYGYV